MGLFEWHLTRHLIPWKEQSQYHIFYLVYSSMHGDGRHTVLVLDIYTICMQFYYCNSLVLFYSTLLCLLLGLVHGIKTFSHLWDDSGLYLDH